VQLLFVLFSPFLFSVIFFSFLPTNILIELYISFVNVKDLLDWWLHLSPLHCFCETESIRLTAVFSYLEISNELISNPDLQDPRAIFRPIHGAIDYPLVF